VGGWCCWRQPGAAVEKLGIVQHHFKNRKEMASFLARHFLLRLGFNSKIRVGFSWSEARLCEPQKICNAKAGKVFVLLSQFEAAAGQRSPLHPMAFRWFSDSDSVSQEKLAHLQAAFIAGVPKTGGRPLGPRSPSGRGQG
jgi:hypothetical protein